MKVCQRFSPSTDIKEAKAGLTNHAATHNRLLILLFCTYATDSSSLNKFECTENARSCQVRGSSTGECGVKRWNRCKQRRTTNKNWFHGAAHIYLIYRVYLERTVEASCFAFLIVKAPWVLEHFLAFCRFRQWSKFRFPPSLLDKPKFLPKWSRRGFLWVFTLGPSPDGYIYKHKIPVEREWDFRSMGHAYHSNSVPLLLSSQESVMITRLSLSSSAPIITAIFWRSSTLKQTQRDRTGRKATPPDFHSQPKIVHAANL